jgi:hypothetical protein
MEMEMNEKMKAAICLELDMLKQKVELGIVSRFNFNTDRMMAADGTMMTCTAINCMEEPAVIEETHTTLDVDPNYVGDDCARCSLMDRHERTAGILENEIPPSALNKDLSTFRGVSSETICSQKYDVRNLPPFLAQLAADPENTKLLETVLGRGLKGMGSKESGVYFVSKNDDGDPVVETLIAPKEFVESMRLRGLNDLRENGSEFKATVPLSFTDNVSVIADKYLPGGTIVAVNREDSKPPFPTDLINDVTEF